jgi:5-methylcytosine-specific restriction enzyme subunit McrC
VRPDIVVRDRAGDPVLIIDTKWKRVAPRIDDKKQGVAQADVYQMMAYGRLYGCPRLMLLYPHHGALGAEGETGRYRILGSGDTLSTATIDLGTPGVEARLARLCLDTVQAAELAAA